jgi:hypothetical protein
MSTWINRAVPVVGFLRLSSLLASVALAACVATGPPGTRAVAVSGGAVTVTGPQGYCIDRGATRQGASGAFVLFGTCAALTRSASAAQPARAAVLTASVGQPAAEGIDLAANLPAMAAFFRSVPGRAALSRSGDAATVRVEEVGQSGDALYIRLSDSAVAAGQSVEPAYWRALMPVRGRIVTLAVLSPVGAPLRSSEQRAVLDRFAARMRAANAGTGGAATSG